MTQNQQPKLVVVSDGFSYKRFVGRQLTHNVVCDDRALTPAEVEQFRVDPLSLLEPDSPEAA